MTATYTGEELKVFQYAANWKSYFASFFKPYVKGDVVEVGAGFGANVPYLINPAVNHYLCIEPEESLAAAIAEKIAYGRLPEICSVQKGFLQDGVMDAFDTILYIDVLEHIEDDVAEIRKAAKALKDGGWLCILVPANPKDYSAFDKRIGHYRRYTKQTLLEAVDGVLQTKWCHHLDSFGLLASKLNKRVLRQSRPGKKQVLFWDRLMIPASRIIDRVLGYRFGKSLLLVAQKQPRSKASSF